MLILDDILFAIKTVAYTALALAGLTIVGLALPNFIDSVESFNDDAPTYQHTGFTPDCPEWEGENTLPPTYDERGEE